MNVDSNCDAIPQYAKSLLDKGPCRLVATESPSDMRTFRNSQTVAGMNKLGVLAEFLMVGSSEATDDEILETADRANSQL